MTRTYATLEVSPAAFREIRDAFIEVGYTHVFETDETKNVIVIDMHGVGLTCKQIEATSGPCPSPGAEDEEALKREAARATDNKLIQGLICKYPTVRFIEMRGPTLTINKVIGDGQITLQAHQAIGSPEQVKAWIEYNLKIKGKKFNTIVGLTQTPPIKVVVAYETVVDKRHIGRATCPYCSSN